MIDLALEEKLDDLDPLRHLRDDLDLDSDPKTTRTSDGIVPAQIPSILNQRIELAFSSGLGRRSRGSPLPPDIHRPSVILAADCVYFEPAFPLLVHTLAELVPRPSDSDAASDRPEVLFCYKKRRKADKRFFTLLKREFTWTEVTDDPDREVYAREAISLLRLTRKR
ncbi:hypothetical protein EVJ58_g7859 [Rhodofomes roseus]|uniref:Uncharacterized protein n=1 Tax=Rhodofomes roseus TaxID=34475 RepID=A0A4Y9Y2C5_9APHY|nr:hypothetical protein EVJ58_g7859 [Rhodofomes roseus]